MEGSLEGTIHVDFRLRKHTGSSEYISIKGNISGSWKTGIGLETIIGNRNRTREMQCEVEWSRVQGLGFGTGIGDRDMKQSDCYELRWGLRGYRGARCSARTWLQHMYCTTRCLLSSNFGHGSEVRTRSSRDNQCQFQTEEHT